MIGEATQRPLSALDGWSEDNHAAALSAYMLTVDLLAQQWPRPNGQPAREFFEEGFEARACGEASLLTGYYEPVIEGSTEPSGRFRFALYGPPPDLSPDRPWHDRSAIEERALLRGLELVWVESALDAFLAQVQGSVSVRLHDGTLVRLGFAGKNGHPYTSIGKELVSRGVFREDEASIAAIRAWAECNPGDLASLLRVNRSYVFFRRMNLDPDSGPLGTMQRPVTPLRSIAVDPDVITLGSPVWVQWKGHAQLMIAQDTGSAIKGRGRGDIFFGAGPEAGRLAGELKTKGRMTALLPRIRP